MKKSTLVVLLLIATQVTFGQNPDLKVGQKTPDLVITDYILNTPKDKNFSNKFKVVEFWATWCGPCLGAVPHLNELQNKFKDNKNLVFISISDEAPEKINKTLSKIKFETIVVSDQTKKTHENLIMRKDKSYSIPATILIDDQNIVRFIGRPEMLTSELIDKFINGQLQDFNEVKKEITEVNQTTEPENKDVSARDLLKIYTSERVNKSVFLAESNPNHKRDVPTLWDFSKSKLMVFNWDLQSIFAALNEVPDYKIIVSKDISSLKYDFLFIDKNLLENKALFEKDMKLFLMNTLKLKEVNTTRISDVYLLKIMDAKKLKENENTDVKSGHSGSSDQYFNFDGTDLKYVSEGICNNFNIIVIDESNSNAKYNFLFKKGSFEELIKELNAYGLTLEKAQRNIDCIQYEK
jgi:thiol-disulfide isomerase/thioredoxin